MTPRHSCHRFHHHCHRSHHLCHRFHHKLSILEIFVPPQMELPPTLYGDDLVNGNTEMMTQVMMMVMVMMITQMMMTWLVK